MEKSLKSFEEIMKKFSRELKKNFGNSVNKI